MTRKVHRLNRLQAVEFTSDGPFKTDPKFRGKAAEGIAYQAKVQRAVETLTGNHMAEQWIRFKDSGRWHYCRPDTITENPDRVLVVESKLSLRQLAKGLAQLRLYKPLLHQLFGKPVVCVLAFKHWTLGSQDALPMIDDIRETLWTPMPRLRQTVGWNFIGA